MNTNMGGTCGTCRRTATTRAAGRGAPKRFRDLRIGPTLGSITYSDATGLSHSANLALLLIHEAWDKGCNFEDLADGFGRGLGTHGDWSAIRDSTGGAIERMLERALNHLLP
jgi:hypothetical protein